MKKGTIHVPVADSICVYNTAVPELMAVFKDMLLLTRYIFGKYHRTPERNRGHVDYALKAKKVIPADENALGLYIALRYGSKEHVTMLEGERYKLLVSYIPKVSHDCLLGFKDTAESFVMVHNSKPVHPNAIAGSKAMKGKGARKPMSKFKPYDI